MNLSIKFFVYIIIFISPALFSQTSFPVLNNNSDVERISKAEKNLIDYESVKDAVQLIKINDIYKTKSFLYLNDEDYSEEHSFFNVTGQLVIGTTLSVGFAIIPFAISFGQAWSGKKTEHGTIADIITIPAFLFGTAVGVHWIASYENPNVSLLKTFKYSIYGGCFSAALVAYMASRYTTIPEVGGIIAFFAPVISSVLYTTHVAEWTPANNIEESISKKYYYHKDLIDQDKLFEVELLKVTL